jgi:hypothetical protein
LRFLGGWPLSATVTDYVGESEITANIDNMPVRFAAQCKPKSRGATVALPVAAE